MNASFKPLLQMTKLTSSVVQGSALDTPDSLHRIPYAENAHTHTHKHAGTHARTRSAAQKQGKPEQVIRSDNIRRLLYRSFTFSAGIALLSGGRMKSFVEGCSQCFGPR